MMINPDKATGIAKYILFTGFLCGPLDAIAAILLNPDVSPASIFKFIASGFFGREAYLAGNGMVIYGILFHYFIAFIFTALLFRLYPFFINTVQNKYVLMAAIGLLIWIVMNMLVLPLSHTRLSPFNMPTVLKNIAALIVAMGVPITLIAERYYTGKD